MLSTIDSNIKIFSRTIFGEKDTEMVLLDSESSTHSDMSSHSEYRDNPRPKPVISFDIHSSYVLVFQVPEFKSTYVPTSLSVPPVTSSLLPQSSLPGHSSISSSPYASASETKNSGLSTLTSRHQPSSISSLSPSVASSVEAAVAAALTPESLTLPKTPIPLLDDEEIG